MPQYTYEILCVHIKTGAEKIFEWEGSKPEEAARRCVDTHQDYKAVATRGKATCLSIGILPIMNPAEK